MSFLTVRTVVSLVVLLVLCSAGVEEVSAASLSDYANSAAHAVGLDSLLRNPSPSLPPRSAPATTAAPPCCDSRSVFPTLLNPLSPCPTQVVQAKSGDLDEAETVQRVVDLVRPAATPCPTPVPVPACVPCPEASATKNSKAAMWNVVQKGRDLATRWTGILAAPAVYTNKRIADGAALLPDLLSAQGRIVGSAIAAPVQFVAGKNSLVAKGVSGLVVGVPVAIGTGITAGAAGLVQAVRDLRNRNTFCSCRAVDDSDRSSVLQLGLRLPVRPFGLPSFSSFIPCPTTCPDGQVGVLLAAGSEADESVTESPVMEQSTGSSMKTAEQESVTRADLVL